MMLKKNTVNRHAPGLLPILAASLVFPCLAAAEPPWRFVATGDSRGDDNGVNSQILTEIAARIVAEQPDLVVFPGDLVEGSDDTETLISQLTDWRTIMQPVYLAGISVLAVRGNHEDQGSVAAWNAVFAGPYAMPGDGPASEINVTYSLAHKNAFFAGLDQYSGHEHRVDQTWLDAQLIANRRPHVFVFGHEPAYRAAHEDCLDSYPDERDAFWAGLAAAGARAYICGHDHFYDHARVDDGDGNPNDDLHQLIIGAAGAPLYEFDGSYNGDNGGMTPLQQYYAAEYGYVVVDVVGLQVTLTWMQRVEPGVYSAAETWTYKAAPRRGDLNCDAGLDAADIGPFVLALTAPELYLSIHSDCDINTADINGDELIDDADVREFVAALIAQ